MAIRLEKFHRQHKVLIAGRGRWPVQEIEQRVGVREDGAGLVGGDRQRAEELFGGFCFLRKQASDVLGNFHGMVIVSGFILKLAVRNGAAATIILSGG
ncbi:hypothetical protein [Planctomycetes bacterium TBK1r]|uniref:hypothetical protein n=1 Tax=Stieleria magnilauensis TaxID=2527963 RepID=UPI0011A0A321